LQHVLRKVRRGFFAMSRSIFSRATSALSLAISACSGVTTGAARPSAVIPNWPLASARTQLVRLALGIPSVLATTDAARPALTCLTASCLNSSVYFPRRLSSFTSRLLFRDSPGMSYELRSSGATSACNT
jgi:hypothetical protein